MGIKGIPVILVEKEQSSTDPFGNPVFTESEVVIENVLVSPVDSADRLNEVTLSGKKAVYRLCIPKGDTHNWTDTRVKFFNETFRTIGVPKEYIEAMVPLEWNKQIEVERFE